VWRLLANQLPEQRAEDQHRVTRYALGGREIADRVIRAEQMRVAVDDEESFHCSGVLEAATIEGGLRTVRAGFIVAMSPRPAWTEGGLRQALAGSAAAYSSRCGPRARLAVHGPRGGPALHTLLVRVSHGVRVLAVRIEERLARLVAQGGGDARGHGPGQLERVRRPRAEKAERGRDAPEEPVALDEPGCGRVIEGAGAREALERRRRREPPHVGLVMPVDELERLGEELDVDEPAAAVLHVQAPARLAAELALHPRAHLRDLLQRSAREGVAVHQPGDCRADTAPEDAITQDEPRQAQGPALPQVAM